MNADQRVTLQLGELLKMVCILQANDEAKDAMIKERDARIEERDATIKVLEAKLPPEAAVDSETPK